MALGIATGEHGPTTRCKGRACCFPINFIEKKTIHCTSTIDWDRQIGQLRKGK